MKRRLFTIMAFLCAIASWGQTDVTSQYLANPDFEGTYSVQSNPSSDRAIYEPDGWTVALTNVNVNDMSILKSTDLASNSFSDFTVNDNEVRGEQTYWFRFRWGSNQTLTVAQTVANLPAGVYRLTADVLNFSTDYNYTVMIYAGEQAQTRASVSTTKGDAWNTLTCDFYVENDGDVEIGLSATNPTALERIFAVDNFKLYRLDSEEPTDAYPVSMTGCIVNPCFDVDVTGWTYTTGAQNHGRATNRGGDITGGFFENWNGSAYSGTIEQSLSGLPNGKYTLKLAAFRQGGTGETYVFANDDMTLITTDDGAYYEVETTVVDGTMTFGLKSVNGGCIWAGIDNASLVYRGADLSLLIDIFNESSNALSTLVGRSDVIALVDVFQAVGTEIESVQTLIESVNADIADGSVTQKALRNTTATIDDLNILINGLLPVYEKYSEKLAECEVIATNSITEVEETRTQFNSAITVVKNMASKVKTIDGVGSGNALITALETARQSYVVNAEPTNGVTFDLTFKVTNADFASTSGWGGTLPALGSGVAEFYSKSFDMSQTLTGLSNGIYEVSCQGFYRMGGATAAATAHSDGTEKLNALLYANDVTASLMSVFECAQTGQLYSNDANTTLGWIPDQMNGAAAYFDKGYYLSGETAYNKVQVKVTDGTLTFGLKKTELVSSDWTIFDNFNMVKVRSLNADEYAGEIEAWRTKAQALVETKPLGVNEKAALETALTASADLAGKTVFELDALIADLQAAVAAVDPWRTAYDEAKKPLVAAFERFEQDYNDGVNGPLRPMSTEAWNTLLEAVKVAAEAKDVTDAYDGFETATTTFNAAMDAVEPSIVLYAGYASFISALGLIDDVSLLAAVNGANTDAYHASDAKIEEAILVMDEAFATYKNTQNGSFSLNALLGGNLDFETEPTVTDERNTQAFEIPEWNNVFVSNPTDGNLQYVFKTRTTDVAEGVTTANSLRMRSKWDQIETKMQIWKDTYLPSGEYTISFYMKEPQTSGFIENLCYYELDGVRTEITASATWEHKTINLSVSKPTPFSLSFGFLRDTDSNGGHDADIYVDDVELVCQTETAFARAMAAAKAETSSLAAQAAVAEYDGREKELTEAGTVDAAIEVLLNSVTIAQNGEYATSLIKNVDFKGGTTTLSTASGTVVRPNDWDFEYNYTGSGWNETIVNSNYEYNVWAASITAAELMQTLTSLPNGVYRLFADVQTDANEGNSWIAIYGAPANASGSSNYSAIGRAKNVTSADFTTYSVDFVVVNHAVTIGIRTDAYWFKVKNFTLQFVAPADTEDAEILSNIDNGLLYQKAYVDRDNAEVDLSAFTNASGATVYLNRANALIKAASATAVTNAQNVIVDGACANFVLTDKEPFAATTEFVAESASYTREMTNAWGTLILPYAMASDDNLTFYQLTGTREEGDESYMTFESVEELPANTPCAFRHTGEGTTVSFEAASATVGVPASGKVSAETGLAGWTAEGYYESATITDAATLANTYYISNNMFMQATESLAIAPFRATFVDASTNGASRFLIDFNDLTTGISNASSEVPALAVFGERGALRLSAGHTVRYAVYTLGGMLMEQGTLQSGEERTLSLSAGVYIVNGLKVHVK